ncbi:PREDICTED: putative E3 ubiquitin-protein ligase XBAT34 [Ipomoea nil]|uniref:putative E3 ubiquitin-protein ligase XBAT34 n=1 Tax=Ipomoea nil TaxID=35883 RepID=UPI000900ADD1|nr:PREDICTED: putative E3 ubiquitin-protein ligase XBAT34 [Ipomoea nil]
MGQQQSKDELLYQQVNYGNTAGIKTLRNDGAGLEWIDREGKTPLIMACMNPQLFDVAKTLIELGANVNAYRPGRHAGTPLHHAAKRGLVKTVSLLLSHGANPLAMNDDCLTPLDVARLKGYTNVVRTIERHICLFAGWLRELYGPGFLELLAPQLLSRKVWVVVLPCGSRNLTKPFKLELAIYPTPREAQPRTVFALWKANMEEPNFNLPDPTVVISDISKKTRIKLASVQENDKPQLQSFCEACKGNPQVIPPPFIFNTQVPVIPATSLIALEDEELAMAINASIQSAAQETPPEVASTSGIYPADVTTHADTSVLGEIQEAGQSIHPVHHAPPQKLVENPEPSFIPSAPPLDDGPVHYPSIDSTPVDFSSQTVEAAAVRTDEDRDRPGASSCVICLDAPVEGACIPCGHMAGCMSCLNEIKAKKWGCPVCRAKIDQVIRLYAV